MVDSQLNIEENELCWHAVYVASRQEKKVMVELQIKGIESYVPMVKSLRQWSDRRKWVELPLINGYVFLRITEKKREEVFNVRGIVNFVRSVGKIAIIPDKEMDRLKQIVSLGYELEVVPTPENYEIGDLVKIKGGPLKDMEGKIIQAVTGQKFEILLDKTGHCIRVSLPAGSFVPLEPDFA